MSKGMYERADRLGFTLGLESDGMSTMRKFVIRRGDSDAVLFRSGYESDIRSFLDGAESAANEAIQRGIARVENTRTMTAVDVLRIIGELEAENARLREALLRIASWPYNIMGDCVADAREDARAALEGGD